MMKKEQLKVVFAQCTLLKSDLAKREQGSELAWLPDANVYPG